MDREHNPNLVALLDGNGSCTYYIIRAGRSLDSCERHRLLLSRDEFHAINQIIANNARLKLETAIYI